MSETKQDEMLSGMDLDQAVVRVNWPDAYCEQSKVNRNYFILRPCNYPEPHPDIGEMQWECGNGATEPEAWANAADKVIEAHYRFIPCGGGSVHHPASHYNYKWVRREDDYTSVEYVHEKDCLKSAKRDYVERAMDNSQDSKGATYTECMYCHYEITLEEGVWKDKRKDHGGSMVTECWARKTAGPHEPTQAVSAGEAKSPCGECHLHPNETCDICGAVASPQVEAGAQGDRSGLLITLRDALMVAVSHEVHPHSAGCLTLLPTEEWTAENGNYRLECKCDWAEVRAALDSVESALATPPSAPAPAEAVELPEMAVAARAAEAIANHTENEQARLTAVLETKDNPEDGGRCPICLAWWWEHNSWQKGYCQGRLQQHAESAITSEERMRKIAGLLDEVAECERQLRAALQDAASARAERDELIAQRDASTPHRNRNYETNPVSIERLEQMCNETRWWKSDGDEIYRVVHELRDLRASHSAAEQAHETLRGAFAFLQKQGRTDSAGDFVLNITLSKHHASLDTAILDWMERAKRVTAGLDEDGGANALPGANGHAGGSQ